MDDIIRKPPRFPFEPRRRYNVAAHKLHVLAQHSFHHCVVAGCPFLLDASLEGVMEYKDARLGAGSYVEQVRDIVSDDAIVRARVFQGLRQGDRTGIGR